MRDLFQKGQTLPESLQKDLEEFKEWKTQNSKESEKTRFENEFTETLPALKTFFPNANDSEFKAIKQELDKISHSDGWNDKDLEYIEFKHKDALSALVSPKKRGMENVDRKDEGENNSDFNPNADYAKMSPTERAKWEKQYNEITSKGDGLTEGSGGKKIII